MKTILVPVDFGKHSDKAIEIAIHMAASSGAKIILTHSFKAYSGEVNPVLDINSDLYEELKEHSEKTLSTYVERISSLRDINGNPIHTDCIVHQNFAAPEIISLTQETQADLIIMGTEKHSNLSIFLGSVSLEVLHKAGCPVLIVHEDTPVTPLKSLYLGIENISRDMYCLEQLIPLARVFNAVIYIVHINSNPLTIDELKSQHDEKVKAEQRIASLQKQYDYPYIQLQYSASDNVILKLDDILLEESPDLMALLYQKRKWTDALFHKSLIRYLLIHTSTPLLILH